jgi:hypothetical protein
MGTHDYTFDSANQEEKPMPEIKLNFDHHKHYTSKSIST